MTKLNSKRSNIPILTLNISSDKLLRIFIEYLGIFVKTIRPTKAKPLLCGPKSTRHYKNFVNDHCMSMKRGDFRQLSYEEYVNMQEACWEEVRSYFNAAEPVKDSGNSSIPPSKDLLLAQTKVREKSHDTPKKSVKRTKTNWVGKRATQESQ
jgi:hypothetical protein